MFFNFIKNFILREKKASTIIFFSVALGSGIVSMMLSISMEIETNMTRELRSFGANIVVEPRIEGTLSFAGQKEYLYEDDIKKVKTIFWRHNIIGLAPILELPIEITIGSSNIKVVAKGTWFEKDIPLSGETDVFKTGIFSISPWWSIDGNVPSHGEVIIGVDIASRHGLKKDDEIVINNKYRYRISGILTTGAEEDNEIIMELSDLQKIKGIEGKITRLLVSAMTTPMDEFAYKDPSKMTKTEYEKWYCTGYVTSIAKQIEEVMRDSSARPVWRIAETEGKILNKLKITIYLLCFFVIISSITGVSSTMMSSIMRRRREIGLMKAMGGGTLKVSTILISGVLVIALIASIGGFFLSIPLAGYVGNKVFETSFERKEILFYISIITALFITFCGSIFPLRSTIRIEPAIVLKGIE